MPEVITNTSSGNAYIDGILNNVKWGTDDFTFSFPTSGSYYGNPYSQGENLNGFDPLTASQRTAIRAALGQFASVANLSFTEIAETSTQHADLRFAETGLPAVNTAWAVLPHPSPEGGDVWFNNGSQTNFSNLSTKGSYAYQVVLHEIGHALGLVHAWGGGVGMPMPIDRNSLEYTVMGVSYVGASSTAAYSNEPSGYAQSLMMYDIAALQHMYGANFSTNSGSTTYMWDPDTGEASIDGVPQGVPGSNRIFQTIWDGSGFDNYDFSNYTTDLTVSLEPGAWTTTSPTQLAYLGGGHYARGNIANALLYGGDTRSLIEVVIGGSGNDTITGNIATNVLDGAGGQDNLCGLDRNDTLYGRSGNDSLYGGEANDTLKGGAGADTLVGGRGNDLLDGGAGFDWAQYQSSASSVDVFLDRGISVGSGIGDAGDTLVSIEGVKGTNLMDTIVGNAINNTLLGNGGNDRLEGGGGADTMNGGAGADIIRYRSSTDSLNTARDLIQGLAAEDQIDLSLLDAATSTSTVNDAFRVVSTLAAAQTSAGSLFLSPLCGTERLAYLNTDTDSLFEMVIRIRGTVTTADFTL